MESTFRLTFSRWRGCRPFAYLDGSSVHSSLVPCLISLFVHDCYKAPKVASWVCDYSSHFSFRTVLDFLSSISRLNSSLLFHSEHYIILQHQDRKLPIKKTIVGLFLLASSRSPGSTWWSFCMLLTKWESLVGYKSRGTFSPQRSLGKQLTVLVDLTQVAHRRCGCLLQISEPSTVLLQGQHNHSLSQLQ